MPKAMRKDEGGMRFSDRSDYYFWTWVLSWPGD